MKSRFAVAKSREVVAEVARQGDRLQEHLGQQHRGAHVQVDAAAAELRHQAGQDPEVEMAGAAHRGRIAGRVHVHDVGADRDVHGGGQPQATGRRPAG